MKRLWLRLERSPALLPALLFGAALLLLCVAYGVSYVRIGEALNGQSFIPLHYNVLTGIDRFGPTWRLYLPWWMMSGFWLLNALVAWFAFRRNDRRLACLIGWFTLFLVVLTSIAFLFGLVLILSLLTP